MGPTHKPKSTRVQRGRSVPKLRRKPAPPKRSKLRTASNVLRDAKRIRKAGGAERRRGRVMMPPNLDEILGAFAEAYALLAVSSAMVGQSESAGPERIVLRLGVEVLNRAYNQLDMAIVQLARADKARRAS
jgi:hypothetical protein